MFDFVQKNTLLIKVILGAVALTFVGFGVGSYTASSDDPYLAKVADLKIYKQDVDRVLNGQPADSAVRQQVLESLVRQKLLLADAGAAGLVVSDEALRRAIAAVPAFQDNGKFSPSRYEAFLKAQYLTPVAFEQRLRDELLTEKQVSAFVDASFVTPGEIERMHRLLAEQRQVDAFTLTAADFVADARVDDSAVKKYYDANLARFRLPEQVRLQYVLLSLDQVAQSVQVSDADAEQYFNEHKADLGKEERQLSHILLTVPSGASAADKAKVKAAAEAIDKEVKADPARFAEIARQRSQDPGSAANGGGLGWVPRGMMVKPFEQAAFALKQGEISNVVESEFGYHVIKLDGVRSTEFAAVKQDIKQRMARQKAGATYRQQLERLSDVTYQQADSLKPAADALKLKIEESGWLLRGKPGEGVLANPKLIDAAFSDDVLNGKHNSEVVDIGNDSSAVVRIAEHKPAVQQPLAEVAPIIRQELKLKAAEAMAVKKGKEMLAELKAGKSVSANWGPGQLVSRRAPGALSRDAVRAVFSADAARLPAYAGAVQGNGYVLYRVERVIPAAPINPTDRQYLADLLGKMQANADATSYLNSLREHYKVMIRQMPSAE